MASQYEKRQAKKAAGLVIETKAPEATATTPGILEYTNTALDIYSLDGNKTFKLVEIQYNPETRDVKIGETYNISRIVGLSHSQTKHSLNTLKKK